MGTVCSIAYSSTITYCPGEALWLSSRLLTGRAQVQILPPGPFNMTEDDDLHINPGYPVSELLKALSSSGEHAQKRVRQWQQVLSGLIDRTLQIGSRTPVQNTPPWVTLEVVHGGFATGSFAASGPLTPYELEKLETLRSHEDATNRTVESISQQDGRGPLNLYFMSDQGQTELSALLASGCFRINVPEEGALLIATWLMNKGEPALAAKLVEPILPFFAQLRFYPAPNARPTRLNAGVYVQTAGQCVIGLRAKRPQASVPCMNEAIQIWTPLYDRVVSLFLETIDGEPPAFQTDNEGALVRAANGQPIVVGGWPCRHYPEDFASRAQQLLTDYRRARAHYMRCGKPENRKENFARLRVFLTKAIENPSSLTGRDVGMVRKILASYIMKHGAPGSERLRLTRAGQESMAQRPLHHVLAGVLADRLQDQPEDEGIPELENFFGPLSAAEASGISTKSGAEIPHSVVNKAMRCLDAPLDALIQKRIVTSSEAMSTLLSMLTARIRVSSIADPVLARVFESSYRAFRRRRSLLLLNLASQVRFDELPWISIIAPWVGSNEASSNAARSALIQSTTLAVLSFPQTIFPNKLIKELRVLARASGISIPLVEELAADIFMGKFAENFLNAAKESATLLRGTAYERYYGINYDAILKLNDLESSGKTSISPGFARICAELADGAGSDKVKADRWSVARNGAIIEQSQILTTHNLASLFNALELTDMLRPDLEASARTCFTWVCHRQQLRLNDWKAELQNIKNSAYAWRQMIFYLSLVDQSTRTSFFDWCAEHMTTQTDEFQLRFAPAMQGLVAIAGGAQFDVDGRHSSGGRRFLGWSVDRHWLRMNTDAS